MVTKLRVARPGDICILLEPAVEDMPGMRRLQRGLQSGFGGRRQERIHFTCQRFELPYVNRLPLVLNHLQKKLASVSPFSVKADQLELVDHPFWEFSVLRWDLHLSRQMWELAERVAEALTEAGVTYHYPCGEGWRPHVTALEAIRPSDNGHSPNGQHAGKHLFTGQQVTLSQIAPGKHFEILETIPLDGSAISDQGQSSPRRVINMPQVA